MKAIPGATTALSALVSALVLAAAPVNAADAPAPDAGFGAWGIDLTARDTSVKPGDDFQRYAAGHWLDTHEIPADRASLGTFYDLRERVNDQLKAVITEAPATSKYGALYRSFMDEANVEAQGLKPLLADEARVRALANKRDFARFMGTTEGGFGESLITANAEPDTANAAMNVLWLRQAGLGMPDRDYYLADQFKPQRAAYRAYLERTFAALGTPAPALAADTVLAFETEVAKVSWAAAQRRDLNATNNPMSSAALAAYAPGIDWAAWFAGARIGSQARIIVSENTAIKALAALYATTPLATLKLWQQFHVADQAAPYLAKAMVDSKFAYTKVLSGVTEQRPRWKRAVGLVDGELGELVGQDYVARYFPASSKSRMETLVANLKTAMAGRIRGNGWMSPATKAAALEKLGRMDVMVGYPDKFRSYAALAIDPRDLYGNVVRAGRFNHAYQMADLGKPVDHKKWGMNPQTVNAYNGEQENKIVFPAGILQAPFFDPNADDAVNYGAIGAVIGHEISHGFDDQGRKIDASGALRDWWTAEDGKRFTAEAKVFGDQFAKYEAAPGAFINPDLTMGENIADFAGIQVALDAYHAALGGKTASTLDGLSGDQRLFLAWAQVWRAKQRTDSVRQQVTTDPHSPARFRVIGPVRNIDAWYAAFDVKPGETFYIAPEHRARIW